MHILKQQLLQISGCLGASGSVHDVFSERTAIYVRTVAHSLFIPNVVVVHAFIRRFQEVHGKLGD